MKVRTHRIKLPLREAIKLNGGRGLEKPKGKLNISRYNNWGIKSKWELEWIRKQRQAISRALTTVADGKTVIP